MSWKQIANNLFPSEPVKDELKKTLKIQAMGHPKPNWNEKKSRIEYCNKAEEVHI